MTTARSLPATAIDGVTCIAADLTTVQGVADVAQAVLAMAEILPPGLR